MEENVIIKNAGKKGGGIFAIRDFKKGDIIFKNKRGRIVDKIDFSKLLKDDQIHLNEINKNASEIMNPSGRFVNHSCDPNAVPTESKKQASYIALRRIKKGDEITVDYRINAHDNNKWKCYCGSKNCKGYVISNFFTLPKKLQKKYLPYTIRHIRDGYKRQQKKRN